MTTNQGTGTFVRGHRRVASEWSGISTTSSNESEPLKRDENAEIRVVIFVEAQNEFNWFKNVFINGKFITVRAGPAGVILTSMEPNIFRMLFSIKNQNQKFMML